MFLWRFLFEDGMSMKINDEYSYFSKKARKKNTTKNLEFASSTKFRINNYLNQQ